MEAEASASPYDFFRELLSGLPKGAIVESIEQQDKFAVVINYYLPH